MTKRDAPKRSDAWALLGIARRAGAVQVGVERSREAVRSGEARLVVSAADAAPGQVKKVVALARAREVPVLDGPSRRELGGLVGVAECSALVVTDDRLALEFSERLARSR
jgi:ribosomal protein L7Ae-like RNA K-turn-binding protein